MQKIPPLLSVCPSRSRSWLLDKRIESFWVPMHFCYWPLQKTFAHACLFSSLPLRSSLDWCQLSWWLQFLVNCPVCHDRARLRRNCLKPWKRQNLAIECLVLRDILLSEKLRDGNCWIFQKCWSESQLLCDALSALLPPPSPVYFVLVFRLIITWHLRFVLFQVTDISPEDMAE